jgi:parallel beta-helix repeat protein
MINCTSSIGIWYSEDCLVTGNKISYPTYNGIRIGSSESIIIHNSTITNSTDNALEVMDSRTILVNQMVFEGMNGYGCWLYHTRFLTINESTFVNGDAEYLFFDTVIADVYLNNFYCPIRIVVDSRNTNAITWSNSTHGNYWSVYRGFDNDNNGVGDDAFYISSSFEDPYPLMGSYVPQQIAITTGPATPSSSGPLEPPEPLPLTLYIWGFTIIAEIAIVIVILKRRGQT